LQTTILDGFEKKVNKVEWEREISTFKQETEEVIQTLQKDSGYNRESL
jgi:hypothetical protein